MPSLDLVSPDSLLRGAFREQFDAGNLWHNTENRFEEFASLKDASLAWVARTPQFIVLDETALSTAALPDRLHSGFLFVLGRAGNGIDESLLTETFSKPLRLGYVLARLQFYAQAQTRDESLMLGSWRFSPREHRLFLFAADKTVQLTDKETSLLEYLYRACEPVSRENLLAAVWGYDERIDTHTLETHIYRLRRKLSLQNETLPEDDIFLIDRRGYRINPLWRDA